MNCNTERSHAFVPSPTFVSDSSFVSGFVPCPSTCSSVSFCTWNINGLTVDKLIDIQSCIQQLDFVALLETWLKPGNMYNLSLDGFEVHCLNRESLSRKARRGSSGIVVYIRKEIARGVQIVCDGNLEQLEDRVWFRLDKIFFGLEEDIYLGVWYIPPLGSSRPLQTQKMWGALQSEISYMQLNGKVIVMGDLNARTGNQQDWITMDTIDHVPLPEGYSVDVNMSSMPRASMDCTINACGQMLIDACIATGLRLVNGRLGRDKGVGNFTYMSNSGNSVVDYVLAERAMLDSILSFEVQDLLPFSDHCPLHYTIQCNITTESQCQSGNVTAEETSNRCRFRLNTLRMESMASELSKPTMIAQMQDMVRNQDVQEGASAVEEFLIKVGIDTGVLQRRTEGIHRRGRRPANKWFDDECKQQKRITNDALKAWKNDMSNPVLKRTFLRRGGNSKRSQEGRNVKILTL